MKTSTVCKLLAAGKIMTLLPRSKVNGSQAQCLGWHTIGQCNTSCANAVDHVPYMNAEYAPLVQWCHTCYPADQAATDAALTA